jgi:hypothetical protein
VTLVPLPLPNLTLPPLRLVPLIVTTVPPPVGPALGLTLVTVGAATYVNEPFVVDVAFEFVTATATVPAAPAGDVAVIDVDEVTVTPVAATPLKVTAAPVVVKLVPPIVTDVPPPVGPWFGVTDVTVGLPVGDAC